MTLLAAILALSAARADPVALVAERERFALATPAANVTLERRPWLGQLALRAPRGQRAALARSLRGSRLCPTVRVTGDDVVLECRTRRLSAELVHANGVTALEIVELLVPPWREADGGAPFVPIAAPPDDPETCEGKDVAARIDCLIASGRLDAARSALAAAEAVPGFAALRRGDLALLESSPADAEAAWRAVPPDPPWKAAAEARRCLLEPRCPDSPKGRARLAPDGLPPSLRPEAALRAIRLRALEGGLLDAVRALGPELEPGGACARNLTWCRQLLLAALSLPGEEGSEALATYLQSPDRTEGPLALDLALAAAAHAEALGAPRFSANLLASVTGRIAEAQLPAHLLLTAERYVDGGDRARAEEILLFARVHVPRALWIRSGWARLERRIGQPPPHSVASADAPRDRDLAGASPDRDLAAAEELLMAARFARPGAAAPR